MSSKVAQHNIQRQVGANGDGVGTHETAGYVIGKAQYCLQALAILLIHDRQDLPGDLVG